MHEVFRVGQKGERAGVFPHSAGNLRKIINSALYITMKMSKETMKKGRLEMENWVAEASLPGVQWGFEKRVTRAGSGMKGHGRGCILTQRIQNRVRESIIH